MKKYFITPAFIFIAILSATAQNGGNKVINAADYEKATKFLGDNTSKLVERTDVRPNWLTDGNFWYSVNVAKRKSNYENQANQNFAANLKGKLMLAHGGMDNNVPPYNTYLVVDALVKANKDFDLVIFPNAGHGFGSDSFYMMRRHWDYFVKHLIGAEPQGV